MKNFDANKGHSKLCQNTALSYKGLNLLFGNSEFCGTEIAVAETLFWLITDVLKSGNDLRHNFRPG
jgi:hypothetical protein